METDREMKEVKTSLTTDCTDCTNGNFFLLIRVIHEIRGKKRK